MKKTRHIKAIGRKRRDAGWTLLLLGLIVAAVCAIIFFVGTWLYSLYGGAAVSRLLAYASLGACAVWFAFWMWRDRHAENEPPPGVTCAKCGYSLAGLAADATCPECGKRP